MCYVMFIALHTNSKYECKYTCFCSSLSTFVYNIYFATIRKRRSHARGKLFSLEAQLACCMYIYMSVCVFVCVGVYALVYHSVFIRFFGTNRSIITV